MKVHLGIPAAEAGFVLRHSGGVPGSPMHRHDELEFNLAVEGRGWYLIDEARFPMQPGTFVWLFPEQPHMLVERSADFTMWVVVFRPGLVRLTCRSAETRWLRARRPPERFLKQLPLAATTELAKQCQRLVDCRQQRDLFNAALGHLLLQAWHHFETARSISPEDLHPAVYRAAMLLTQDDLPIADVCARVSLSEAQLRRLFKAQLGQTLSDFRNQRRLTRFVQHYLRHPQDDLSRAAFAAGFGSYPQFYRILRRSLGYSPAEFKRRCQSGEISGDAQRWLR